MKLSVGDAAPAFSLPDQQGKVHASGDLKGQWTLIYFYPKDDTPGCTTEACTIRDAWGAFASTGARVLGVSTDSVKSHAKFADKFKLPFPILADEGKEMVEAYGVWGKKKFMGREYMGTNRVSFLVDPSGKIVKIYDPVKPANHAAEVLADINEMKK